MKKERRLRTEILRLSQFSFFVFCFVFCFVPSISVSFDCVICYVMIPIKHLDTMRSVCLIWEHIGNI